jgi:hypothetical protein
LITQAVAATLYLLREPPGIGFITFVDQQQVKSRNPGYCFKMAGWKLVGRSKIRSLLALQLALKDFPPAESPLNCQLRLLDGDA